MYFCIGIPILLGLLLTPFVYKNISRTQNVVTKKNYNFFLIVGFIATIMSTFIFPWVFMPDILLMIQFPWRMLVVIVFCFSIISSINISIFIEYITNKLKDAKFARINNLSLIIKISTFILIIILSCLYSMSFVTNLDVKVVDNKFYEEPEIIDPKNQVSRYSAFLEYWPQKSINSIDYIINRDNKIAFISGNANIKNESKENGILNFEISDVDEGTSLELPYLFYKGYQVTYTPVNSDSKIKLDVSESDKGLLQLNLDSSISGSINVEYHATTLHKICIIISSITMISYFIYLIVSTIKNRNNSNEVKLLDNKIVSE